MIFDQSPYCLFCLKSTRGLFITKLLSFWKITISLITIFLDLGKARHSTTSVLLSIRDDILKTMNRSECTLLVLADSSKAFDTVKYRSVLEKMNVLGFSKSYLKWTVNYLCGREQFVQIDDRISKPVSISFGVPQGSIMGPLIFNIYIDDRQGKLDCACHQYADDATIHQASKPGQCKVMWIRTAMLGE